MDGVPWAELLAAVQEFERRENDAWKATMRDGDAWWNGVGCHIENLRDFTIRFCTRGDVGESLQDISTGKPKQ